MVAEPFHEHDVELFLHPLRISGTSEEFINEFGAFVERLISEKSPGVGSAGNLAGEIERDSPQELGVVGTRTEGLIFAPGPHERVNSLVKRLVSLDDRQE
jgi:hypothetical protein